MRKCVPQLATDVSRRPGSLRALKLKRISAIAITISTTASTRIVHAVRDRILFLLDLVLVAEDRIELNPGHIGFGHIGEMAPGACFQGRFCSGCLISERLMPESAVAPPG